MKPRHYFVLFLLGIATASIVAFFQSSPGYMDADYYYAGGLQLAGGKGFTEPFLWNYLDNPASLPHASHAYWMPMASLLAAFAMALTGNHTFSAARLGFIFFAGLVPPITAALADRLGERRSAAILAGILAAFSGFYFVFLPTTDTFGVCMVLGGLFFLLSGKLNAATRINRRSVFLTLGILAGLLHLSRADGLIWLITALVAVYFSINWMEWKPISGPGKPTGGRVDWLRRRVVEMLPGGLLVLLGYFIIMGPWMVRNWLVFRTPLSPGAGHTLWLTNYDELFIYPAAILKPGRWWSTGVGAILKARAWALGQNLQTVLAVQGVIFLAPLILAGIWQRRKDQRIRLGLFAWVLVVILMTFFFPFAGARGGLFHAGAALQPLFWALVPVGLEAFIRMGSRLRGWKEPTAYKTFSVGIVMLAMMLSFLTAHSRLAGSGSQFLAWGQEQVSYRNLDAAILSSGASPEDVVMVNNPPGYYSATARRAIFTPYGDVSTLRTVAKRYHARYLLLEYNHPKDLDGLYDDPGDRPGLRYLFEFEDTQVYAIQ